MAAPAVQPGPLAYYALDEASLAAPGDNEDGTGNGYGGDPLGSADTLSDGYVCRGLDVVANTSAAVWDGVDTNVDMDDDVGSRGTITLWYRSDAAWIGGPDRALFDAARTNKYFDAMVDSAGRVTFNLETLDFLNVCGFYLFFRCSCGNCKLGMCRALPAPTVILVLPRTSTRDVQKSEYFRRVSRL